jgi:hypothetical protein
MYDIEKALKTPEQCRTVMERALAHGKKDIYAAAFRQFCKLSPAVHDDPADPLIRAAFEAVADTNRHLKRNWEKTACVRTRQKIAKKVTNLLSTGRSSMAIVLAHRGLMIVHV